MKYNFKIKGLDCANCAANLENTIKKIEGILDTSISFMAERLVIECNEENKEEILRKINKVIKKEDPDITIKEV